MAGILPSGIGGCCSGNCSTTSINTLISEAVEAASVRAASLCGSGLPEGVVTGNYCGQIYTDTDTASLYTFVGTPGTKIGWNP
jgi:hypothetical protein